MSMDRWQPRHAAPVRPAPQVAPGWYPDPQQPALVRWWDGYRWTDATQASFAPMAAAAFAPQPANNTFHLIATVLTCGAWLPVWVFMAWWQNRQRATYREHLSRGY